MKIINQSYKVLTRPFDIQSIPQMIELAGRTCYKSEDKITHDSANDFCRMLIKRGHEAMIEHGNISVKFITDRGVTHELVRHRVASFAQESTRYCNYGNKDMEFIRPVFDWAQSDGFNISLDVNYKWKTWYQSMEMAENCYQILLKEGCSPQEARSVLPNSLKTEIIVTANIREWRHILKLRCSIAAHPQIRKLMEPLLIGFKLLVPALFEDIIIIDNGG